MIDPNSTTPTPESFWIPFKSYLHAHGSWQTYLSNTNWTSFITTAAESVCSSFGYQTNREYLRLDLAAWTQRTPNTYDWNLRVAFEAENCSAWDDELCKLSHIVADLRVLVAYNLHKSKSCADLLAAHLDLHRSRATRIPGCHWLFVFGPRLPEDSWTAFTLTASGEITPIADLRPLLGKEMGIREVAVST